LKKVWYKWPKNYYNNSLRPWYSILRRLIAFPFAIVLFVLFLGVVALGYGREEATQILRMYFDTAC